jgi:hypothetical protein
MTRATFKILTALLWLGPMAIALRYRQVWGRLPARMATHFDAAGRANGWMTPEVSLYYSAGFLAFLAAVFFTALLLVLVKYPLAKLSWALLIFFHAELWTFVYLMNSMLEFSLSGRQIATAPLPIVTAVASLLVVIVGIGEKRGGILPGVDVFAQEVHAGKLWGAILIVPVGLSLIFSLATPNQTARVALVAIGIVLAAAIAMAWDGFHYYFSRSGVEIRTLGFRLKSIPASDIQSYEIESWNPARGLGIRGVGNRKAYVWGRTGVRLHLDDGEVFLGHSDPQRIVHDLNVIKRYQLS